MVLAARLLNLSMKMFFCRCQPTVWLTGSIHLWNWHANFYWPKSIWSIEIHSWGLFCIPDTVKSVPSLSLKVKFASCTLELLVNLTNSASPATLHPENYLIFEYRYILKFQLWLGKFWGPKFETTKCKSLSCNECSVYSLFFFWTNNR